MFIVAIALAGCASHQPPAPSGKALLGVVPDLASEDSHVGVLISGTTPQTPAAECGLQAGDLLVRFDELPIQNLNDLTNALLAAHPGQHVTLTVLRAEKTVQIKATLGAR